MDAAAFKAVRGALTLSWLSSILRRSRHISQHCWSPGNKMPGLFIYSSSAVDGNKKPLSQRERGFIEFLQTINLHQQQVSVLLLEELVQLVVFFR